MEMTVLELAQHMINVGAVENITLIEPIENVSCGFLGKEEPDDYQQPYMKLGNCTLNPKELKIYDGHLDPDDLQGVGCYIMFSHRPEDEDLDPTEKYLYSLQMSNPLHASAKVCIK